MTRQTDPRIARGTERSCVRTTNPFALPARFHSEVDGWLAHLLPIVREVVVSPRRVAVRTRVFGITAGLRILPISQFKGVVISMREHSGPEGPLTAKLELNHADSRLSVLLFKAFDTLDIVSHWQSWARCLHLPILLRNGKGEIVDPANRLGRLVVKMPLCRRRGRTHGTRRPVFPLFRKPGAIADADVFSCREMIARS